MRKWILVSGTGLEYGLSGAEVQISKALGAAIATRGYGLVVGGWHGIDYLAAEEFDKAGAREFRSEPLSDLLLQVVPGGARPAFQGGHVVTVERGPAEWVEALRFADAVVLVGGRGGTYRTYAHAIQERKAVFPILASGGDAAAVYGEMSHHWHAAGIWGVASASFASVLGREVNSSEAARELADALMTLVGDHFAFQTASPGRNSLFFSYARSDLGWLVTIKDQLRALPEPAFVMWDDNEILVGSRFEREVQKALRASRACVLIVTPEFLSSDFIRQHELPYLLRARDNGLMEIFWVHVRRCDYAGTALGGIHAAHDPKIPIEELPPSLQREAVAAIGLKIARSLRAQVG